MSARMFTSDLGERFYTDLDSLGQIKCDAGFAQRVYAAMCNTQWKHTSSDELWAVTWRTAGEVIATLRGDYRRYGYCDWYCSGNEGTVAADVADALALLGWTPVPYEDDE